MTRSRYNVNPLCDAGQAGPPKAALRMGDYKLLSWCYSIAGVGGGATTGPIMCPQNDTSCDPEFKKGPVLYNLKDDISESKNVADQHPEVVKRLTALGEQAREDLGDSGTRRKGKNNRQPGRVD